MQDDVEALCAALKAEIGASHWSDREAAELLVARGQITPELAEAWAKKHDEPSFEERPDASKLDPMAEPYWTLPMALAWVAWRTPDAVRSCWSVYVARCRDWHGHGPGYRLMPREQPSVLDVQWSIQTAEADGDPTLKSSSDDTLRQLGNALKEGRPLIARHGVRNIEVIPARSWDVLCSFADVPARRKPDAVFDADGELLFERVRVDRDAVLAVWPPMTSIEGGRTRDIEVARFSGSESGTKPAIAHPPTGPMRDEVLISFIKAENTPLGLSKDGLFDWLQGRAATTGRRVDRQSVRDLHGTDAYPVVAPLGRPRNPAK